MLRHERAGDTVVVYLSGELDHHRASIIRQELEALIAPEDIQSLIMDVSGLSFMDSSGIGVIIGRYKTMSQRGGVVWVQGASGRIDQIFELSGLYRIIQKKEAV